MSYGIMTPVLLFIKKHGKTFLFVLLPLALLSVYLWSKSGYMEQQRTLWNEYMDQSPDYIPLNDVIEPYTDSMLYKRAKWVDGISGSQEDPEEPAPWELIQTAKDKIYDLNRKDAPDWKVEFPLKPDLKKLSFEGMTELELLSLPADRHSPEYYAELLTRFQKDGQKSREILRDMQKKGISHSSFLFNLFQYKSGIENTDTNVNDSRNISQIPGYEYFISSVNSGNFPAYQMGKIMEFVPDASRLEKSIRDKAEQGDSLAQKQLGDLLMERLQNNYEMGNTEVNWDKVYALPHILEKCLDMLPVKQTSNWEKKMLNIFPKRNFLNRLPEKKELDEALLWYRKSADQGNTDAMYAWLTGHFNYMPRYFTRNEWKLVRQYNDILISRGDWRVCLQLTLRRRITLACIPFLLYSHQSLDDMVRKVDESGRGDGSLFFLKYADQRQFQNRPRVRDCLRLGVRPEAVKEPQWKSLRTPEDTNLTDKLKKLARISPYSCTFHFIECYYIDAPCAEPVLIAKNILEKSSQKGDPVSLYMLGWFHQEGLEYAKDTRRAMELWEKAFLSFDQCGGSDVALAPYSRLAPLVYALPRKLIEYNLDPDFPQRNPARAYEIAIMMQDCDLSKMEKDTDSLNRHEPSFLYFLGKMYEKGEGTARNIDKAFACYQKGKKQLNPYCIFELGRCYEVGMGTDIDKTKAAALYKEAVSNTYNSKLSQIIKKRLEELEKSI